MSDTDEDYERMTWEKMPRVPCAKCDNTGHLMNFAGVCADCWVQLEPNERAAMRGRDVEVVEQIVRVERVVERVIEKPVDNSQHTHTTVYQPLQYWRVMVVSAAFGAASSGLIWWLIR